MLLLSIIVSLVALASVSASSSSTVTGSYTGTYSYICTSTSQYGSYNGNGNTVVTSSGVSVSSRWYGTGMMTSSGFYGWGSASISAGGYLYYWGICVSGTYASTSTTSMSFSGTGNVGFSSFTVGGSGTYNSAGTTVTGTLTGTPSDISMSSGSSSSSSFPTICGSLSWSASGWRSSGLYYLGSTTSSAHINFYTSTVSGVTKVTGSGIIYKSGVPNYIYLADVSNSAGYWSAQGVAGGRPFSASGSYVLGSNSAINYNYWTTNYVSMTSNDVDAYGSFTCSSSATSYATPLSGYLVDHTTTGSTTSSGLYLYGSMLNGKFEVSVSIAGSNADYITGTYSSSSSGSSSSGSSATSGYWSASGNLHGLSVSASGIFGNGGYWITSSMYASCYIYSSSSSSCSSNQCAMPSLGSTSGGVLRACGSSSTSGTPTFSGSGTYQGYSFTVENGIFLMSGKVRATLKMAMLEMSLSGSSYGGSFTLSGSGPGSYYFSATGMRLGSAWALISGYMRG